MYRSDRIRNKLTINKVTNIRVHYYVVDVRGKTSNVYRTVGSLAEQKRTQEITFKFGSLAVKNTVTLYERLAATDVMFLIWYFFLSFVHSFMVYLVTPIGNSEWLLNYVSL
jgi:hypothetical protein